MLCRQEFGLPTAFRPLHPTRIVLLCRYYHPAADAVHILNYLVAQLVGKFHHRGFSLLVSDTRLSGRAGILADVCFRQGWHKDQGISLSWANYLRAWVVASYVLWSLGLTSGCLRHSFCPLQDILGFRSSSNQCLRPWCENCNYGLEYETCHCTKVPSKPSCLFYDYVY